MAPARLQRVGVQRQVVVGQVEAAGPPAGERLGDRHLELPRRRGLVDVVDPGVGHQRQRVGVVQQVGPAAPGRRGEGGLGPLQRRLVARFYQGVAADPVLRAVYPEEDLAAAEERLRLFLIQYWGGPATYSERRGHPALRMRHARFAIGPAERDAWLRQMTAAVEELALPPELAAPLLDYLRAAAAALTNRP